MNSKIFVLVSNNDDILERVATDIAEIEGSHSIMTQDNLEEQLHRSGVENTPENLAALLTSIAVMYHLPGHHGDEVVKFFLRDAEVIPMLGVKVHAIKVIDKGLTVPRALTKLKAYKALSPDDIGHSTWNIFH